MADLPRDLLRPSAFPVPPPSVELVQTHASWVFLAGADVYKVKKPVDFGFLDFRSLGQRRDACEAEVRLNRRLAPDVYRGVLPVRRDARGDLRIGGPEGETGEIVDWAVHMRRLPDEHRADRLLDHGALGGEEVDALADRLAAFHEGARCDAETGRFGEPEVVRGNVEENFVQTRGVAERCLAARDIAEIESRQTSFVRVHADRFRARVAGGRVRDGHGDLRLEHVYFGPDRIEVIDCIEFNDRFRFADVCADIAFLSMDFAWHGRVDLAERLLARYARASDDYDLYALVDFYEGYRAYVRGKVSLMLAADPGAGDALRRRAEEEARRYLLLALSASRPPVTPPGLVCVGGVVACGKTTVAEHLARALAAPVVEADRTRKHLLGVAPSVHIEERPWQGAYDPAWTERVYAELLRRARVVLASGRSVILDASFRTRDLRERARALALASGVPFLFVECRVDPDVARERLRRRESESGTSDARLPMFDDFRARFESPDELAETEHLVLDTGLPLESSLAALRDRLPAWRN
jgi:aminoglycoside phosphotransferase family enzyme/predicted kinase